MTVHPSFRLLGFFAAAVFPLWVPWAYAAKDAGVLTAQLSSAKANITIISEDVERSFSNAAVGNTSPTKSPSLNWQQAGGIRFIPGHTEDVCDEPAQSYYDTRNEIARFLKTLDVKQIDRLKESKSLRLGDMGENQKKTLVDLLRKNDSYIPGLGEQKLSDFSGTTTGQKDVSVKLIFNLGVSFISNRLSPRIAGDVITNLPGVSLGNTPFVPFVDEEEFGKLQETLNEAVKGSSGFEDQSVLANLKGKTVQLSKIAQIEPKKPIKKPLIKWLSDISAATGTSLSVGRELGNRSISVIVDADTSVNVSDLLKALSLAASDATQWRSIQNIYYLSEKSKKKRCKQLLSVKFRELDASMTEYVYSNFSQELRQARLPKGLFLMPYRALSTWPEPTQSLIDNVARRVFVGANNKQTLEVILDPNNRDQIQVNFSIVPILLILYKEGPIPGEVAENSALLTCDIAGFSVDLSQ